MWDNKWNLRETTYGILLGKMNLGQMGEVKASYCHDNLHQNNSQ